MIDEIQLESEERMANSVEHTREELVTIRTGRANPSMFNGVVAEYYGVPTPITQMSSISVPEPRMLLIKPFDMLTEERRLVLFMVAKSKGEDGKIAIRNIRRKAMEQLKKLQKDGDAGEDEIAAAEKEMEKITHNYIEQVDKLVANKEAELMEV